MIDHFLQVELLVPLSKADAFEKASDEFLVHGGFSRFIPDPGYQLALGLRTVDPFRYVGYGRFEETMSASRFRESESANKFRDEVLSNDGQDVHRFVHLWSVPNLIGLDLDGIMRAVVDDKLYLALDDCVVREVQNFVRLVHQPGFPAQFDPSKTEHLRVIRRVSGAEMSQYLFRWGAQLPVWESRGWHALGQYQNVTGTLNYVTEFWQTSPTNLPALRLPDFDPLVRAEVTLDLPNLIAEAHEHYRVTDYFLNDLKRRAEAARKKKEIRGGFREHA